jgi:hypothetical protein
LTCNQPQTNGEKSSGHALSPNSSRLQPGDGDQVDREPRIPRNRFIRSARARSASTPPPRSVVRKSREEAAYRSKAMPSHIMEVSRKAKDHPTSDGDGDEHRRINVTACPVNPVTRMWTRRPGGRARGSTYVASSHQHPRRQPEVLRRARRHDRPAVRHPPISATVPSGRNHLPGNRHHGALPPGAGVRRSPR